MKYQESKPSARLARFVKCYWSIEYQNSTTAEPEPIVPDGCIEIVFDLGDNFRQYDGFGGFELQPNVLVAGQQMAGVLIGPTGNVSLFGIRFWPTGAGHFFEPDVNEISDKIIDLELIWGRSVGLVAEMLSDTSSFYEKIKIVERYLNRKFNIRNVPQFEIESAVELINADAGMKPISHIARMAAISERSLERKFRQTVGLSPKSFSRIVRFQRVLKSFESGVLAGIADAAFRFGYYDQSHLINDFRRFSGLTPTEYLQRSRGMTEAFITTD